MSPNPNAIAVSDAFSVPLTSVMLAGVIPGIVALFVTYFLAKRLSSKGVFIETDDLSVSEDVEKDLPSFLTSIAGPLVAVILLSLRPLFDIVIDPMVALPVGGILGSIIMGKGKDIINQVNFGLSKMSNVAVLLIGTGLIAGIITNSTLGDVLIAVSYTHLTLPTKRIV